MGSNVTTQQEEYKQVHDVYQRMLRMDFNQIQGLCSPYNVFNNHVVEQVCRNGQFWTDKIRQTYPDFPNIFSMGAGLPLGSYVDEMHFAKAMVEHDNDEAINILSHMTYYNQPVFQMWVNHHPDFVQGG